MTYRYGNFGRKNETVFPEEKSENDRIENRDDQQSVESHTDEKCAIAYRQVQSEPYASLGDFGNILRYADAYGGEQWQVTQQRIVDDGRVAVKNIQGIIFSPHERDFIFYADENIEYDSHAYQKRAEESRPGFDPLFIEKMPYRFHKSLIFAGETYKCIFERHVQTVEIFICQSFSVEKFFDGILVVVGIEFVMVVDMLYICGFVFPENHVIAVEVESESFEAVGEVLDWALYQHAVVIHDDDVVDESFHILYDV